VTITFENDNDVIVYALEKIISYARRTQQILKAHCVRWLASIVGLETGLVSHIDNLRTPSETTCQDTKSGSILAPEVDCDSECPVTQRASRNKHLARQVHPEQILRIVNNRGVSATPRDIMEDQRSDQVLDKVEQIMHESERARNSWQRNRVNPLPQSKAQLKKARKAKHQLKKAR